MTPEPEPIFDPATLDRAERIRVAIGGLILSLVIAGGPRALVWLIERCP